MDPNRVDTSKPAAAIANFEAIVDFRSCVDDLKLSTARLQLAPLASSDLEAIWPSVSDPRISRLMSWEPHQSKAETREFIRRIEHDFADSRGITWTLRHDGVFCGIFSIISIVRRHRALEYHRGELAYWCAIEHQGKGFMTEAGRRVIDVGFSLLRLNRIVVAHDITNTGSRNLIERLGFSLIGAEHEAFMKQGRWIDTLCYELLAREHFMTPSTLTAK